MSGKLNKTKEEWSLIAALEPYWRTPTSAAANLSKALEDIAELHALIKTLRDQLDAAEKELHHWRESAGKIRDTGIPTGIELI